MFSSGLFSLSIMSCRIAWNRVFEQQWKVCIGFDLVILYQIFAELSVEIVIQKKKQKILVPVNIFVQHASKTYFSYQTKNGVLFRQLIDNKYIKYKGECYHAYHFQCLSCGFVEWFISSFLKLYFLGLTWMKMLEKSVVHCIVYPVIINLIYLSVLLVDDWSMIELLVLLGNNGMWRLGIKFWRWLMRFLF